MSVSSHVFPQQSVDNKCVNSSRMRPCICTPRISLLVSVGVLNHTERLSRNTAKGFFFRLKHDVIAPALLLSLLTFYYSALLCSHGEFQDLTHETNAVPSQTRPQLFEGLFDTSWSLCTASANRSAVLVRLAMWKSIQLVRPVSVFDVSTSNFSCFSFTNGREGARASFTPLRSVAACLASCTCATDHCIASMKNSEVIPQREKLA